jgi:1-aminocyclopropane-1-carboxylate deaminase/D-cysteine desulfhydrase-like pyridoxal-dependent ACC family enzyme
LGALGYVNAVYELKKQLFTMALPDPDIIYVTLGSTGTVAGIAAAAQVIGLKSKIIPVRVMETPARSARLLCNLINATGMYLREMDQTFSFKEASLIGTQVMIPGVVVEINHACMGEDYAMVTSQAAKSIQILYAATGIKLEATYTGKTFAALVEDAKKGQLKNKNVLFWNTFSYGSYEEFTSQVTVERACSVLPQELHHYLTDALQPLDQGI